jgi:formylglycine-generating enzyme required for sulfatase activity
LTGPQLAALEAARRAPPVREPVRPTVGVFPEHQLGDRFSDCAECPQMVVVPPKPDGFMMGSPPDEEGRDDDEGPQHRVTIAEPFAIGVYEVTFDEWDACVADGGCNGYRPGDVDWGRDRRPVINVSWNDAQAYVAWLAARTGAPYRLPSEAEWEYAARAGTTTPFHFGRTISTEQANYSGKDGYAGGPTGPSRRQTLPVGSFAANAFGLHDVHGNVWEWVEDCWHEDYSAAGRPADGSAWTADGCARRVLRGGAWDFKPDHLRSAVRNRFEPELRNNSFGFRVARSFR